MACIALKVDVDTLRGTREGVPRLLRSCSRRHGAARPSCSASGPTTPAARCGACSGKGFLAQGVAHLGAFEHYGMRTLLYGVALPAPGHRPRARPTRCARRAPPGYECGIHTWDHVVWQDNVRAARRGLDRAPDGAARASAFSEVFGEPPATHGAAGWQMNAAAFRQIERWGLRLCLRRARQRALPCR